jgi:8-oxo-dGTP pyrophosphatase MutT (NUDIX family)
MRTSIASLAVIRLPGSDGLPLYLAQWNDCWQALNLVGGHRHENESHRACMVRELFEELGVLAAADDPDAGGLPANGPRCQLAGAPLGRLEYEAFSQSAGERSFYQIELYAVDLSPEAIAHVARDPDNRWISEAEIEAGRCGDGKAVSDTMRYHWTWLRRHESALMPVYWLISARQRTLESMSEVLAGADDETPFQMECTFVATRLRRMFPQAQAIIVRDRLEGFNRKIRPHKLLVELVSPAEPAVAMQPGPGVWCCREVHLVKIGDSEELEREIRGWLRCSPPGSRDTILTSLEGVRDESGKEMIGLIYGEASNALGGPTRSLEESFVDCCRFGTPTPDSLRHALRLLFGRLYERCYRRSFVAGPEYHFANDPERRTELRRRVAAGLNAFHDLRGEPAGDQSEERRRLRRQALFTLVVGDQPTFLDPIDYLAEALDQPPRVPSMLVGGSHGDLHGRNMLVSMLENEVGQLALFDYEGMRLDNHVGWDFVELEIELKVRTYPHLFRRTRSSFVRELHAFEERLCRRTENFHHDRPAGEDEKETDERRERLAEILLEIRRQASRYLGRQRDGLHAWLEEYYFLLLCYGVQVCRFPTYGPPELLGALVAAGTVARRLSYPWRELEAQINRARQQATDLLQADEFGTAADASTLIDATKRTPTFTNEAEQIGHHARLAFGRTWIQADNVKQRPFIEAAVDLLGVLREKYPHVLEITEVRLAGQLDLDRHDEAERELAELSRQNVELSYEILCRLGQRFKDRGERTWAAELRAMPAAVRQDFELALQAYRRAWGQSRHYNPGINMAALLCLLGQRSEAEGIATEVLRLARQEPGDDPWAGITQGDAHFLLGYHEEARACYQSIRPRCTAQNLRSVLRQMRLLLRVAADETRAFWNCKRLTSLFGADAVIEVLGACAMD